MLIAGELIEEVLLSVFLTIFLLRPELLRDRKLGHDRVRVDAISLHLFDDFLRVFEYFRMVGEDASHLGGCLQPFLFGVVHSSGVVKVFTRAEADEAVVRLAVFLFHKVHIVGSDDLDAIFLRQVEENLVHFLLAFVYFGVATWFVGLVPLHFEIVVISEKVLKPLDGSLGTSHVAVHDLLWHLTCQTCRTAYQAFVVFLKEAMVDTRIVVEAVGVGDRTQLAKAMVARFVLG